MPRNERPRPDRVPEVVPDEPLDPDEVAARLADLERRRLGIGAVNELAATERTELAEREAHIDEQIKDLHESGEALRGHLGELDAAVGEGFEAIFQAVSERFSEVVGLLFPGASAGCGSSSPTRRAATRASRSRSCPRANARGRCRCCPVASGR